MTANNKTVLDNGVRILSRYMPHTRSVSLGVWVDAGARDECRHENGLSHFIEHMIFKGTRRRSGFQIAKEFDAIGGQTNAFTTMEATCYHACVLDTHAPIMIDIMSDIFLNSMFDEKDVENERPVILQEIGMSLESPDDHIHQLHGENFWGADPLGRSILGTPENVSGFNADIIKEYFVNRYQPERIIIGVAGNVSHDGLVDLLAPAFSAIVPLQSRPNPRPVPQTYFRVQACHKELEQTHICLSSAGLSATDPRRFAFSLLNTILGGNMSSRLFQEIRERRGLAYAVYAFSVSYSDTGMLGAYAGVDPKNTYQTVALMVEQLQRMTHEAVSETELHDAKQFTKGNLLLSVESSENQMARLAKNEINWGMHVPMQTVIDKIDAVSAADIQTLADSLFKPGNLSLTLLGPGDPDLDRFQKLLAL